MKKKKFLAVLLGCVLVLASGGCAAWSMQKAEASLKENQRYVYAYITSIQGNEVSYMEVEESVALSMLEEESAEENSQKDDSVNQGDTSSAGERPDMGSFPSGGEMPDMSNFPSGGEMPDMGSFPSGGEMPDMGSFPSGGEMPDMGSFPSGGEMPDMGSFPSGGEMPDMSNFPSEGRSENGTDEMQFGEMSEIVTTYIPVGVTVHTAADVSTTFSRLASGDFIKILVETNAEDVEIIEEIWMLQ